jgi:hypothetical protein
MLYNPPLPRSSVSAPVGTLPVEADLSSATGGGGGLAGKWGNFRFWIKVHCRQAAGSGIQSSRNCNSDQTMPATMSVSGCSNIPCASTYNCIQMHTHTTHHAHKTQKHMSKGCWWGCRCVKLDGRMSFEARDRCIASFAGEFDNYLTV